MTQTRQHNTHGLRREDFPTVYHYRAAIRRATLPPVWPGLGRWNLHPAPSSGAEFQAGVLV